MHEHAASPTPERNKIQALEGIRGPLAWWVVFGHLSATLGISIPLIAQNRLPVDVFIILSGYVIAGMISRKRETYRPYITRRAFRIFPLYLVTLVISTALIPMFIDAALSTPFTNSGNQAFAFASERTLELLPVHFAIHTLMLHGLVPENWLAGEPWLIIGQAWSLSLEWQFYLIAPFVLKALERWWSVAMLLLLLVAAHFIPNMTYAFIGMNKMPLFGIGILSCLYVFGKGSSLMWMAGILLCGLLHIAMNKLTDVIPLLIWGVVFIGLLKPKSLLGFGNRILGHPLMVYSANARLACT